jgi:CheY-like chemotaxis protein
MRALLVDDSVGCVVLAVGDLVHLGFDVQTCGNGDTALEYYRKYGPFALVMTDIAHPGMNGVQLVNAIRRENPEQKIIIVSGAGAAGNLADQYAVREEIARSIPSDVPFVVRFDKDEWIEIIQ